jgi:hypothetical protein
MRQPTDIILREILIDLSIKSRLVETPEDLDQLICEAAPKLQKAMSRQDQLLTEKEIVSRYRFLSENRLRNMRFKGIGPRYIKFGEARNSRVFYRPSDIEAWIVEHYQLDHLVEDAIAKKTAPF